MPKKDEPEARLPRWLEKFITEVKQEENKMKFNAVLEGWQISRKIYKKSRPVLYCSYYDM